MRFGSREASQALDYIGFPRGFWGKIRDARILFERSNPQSGRTEVKILSTFCAVLVTLACGTSSGAANAQQGDAERAKGKLSMCIGCHGIPAYRTAFPEVYHVPYIAGQPPGYIANALKAYRSGDRSHPTMRAIAGSMTDQDIADLAAYYGRPRGGKP
jgi:cytochrome c553